MHANQIMGNWTTGNLDISDKLRQTKQLHNFE